MIGQPIEFLQDFFLDFNTLYQAVGIPPNLGIDAEGRSREDSAPLYREPVGVQTKILGEPVIDFVQFGVRYGNVEVVYSTATVLGREGDVLHLRNHLSGLSKVALRTSGSSAAESWMSPFQAVFLPL